MESNEEISYEDGRTPEPRSCSVTVSDAVNAFNELQLLESPKSTSCYLSANSNVVQSRLNHESKRRTLFPTDKFKLKWTDSEMYALVLFMMLHTDGKQWCAHKDTKFWNDAGVFVQLYSGSSICRSGKYWYIIQSRNGTIYRCIDESQYIRA